MSPQVTEEGPLSLQYSTNICKTDKDGIQKFVIHTDITVLFSCF